MTVQYHFSTIDSTNAYAKRNISLFNKDILSLVTADEQTAGRGRYAKSWHSPKGENIYATYVFFSKQEVDQAHLVQLLAKTAVQTLEHYKVFATIKWPNDLLIDGKKIAGILIEVVDDCIIMGIGLNINMNENSLALIDQKATSLFLETGAMHPPKEVLNLLTKFLQTTLFKFGNDNDVRVNLSL